MLFKIVQFFVGFFLVIEGEDGNIPIHHLALHGAYRHGVGNGVVFLPVVGKPAVKNVRLGIHRDEDREQGQQDKEDHRPLLFVKLYGKILKIIAPLM